MRLAPPLVVTASQADVALAILDEALQDPEPMTSLPTTDQLTARVTAILDECGAGSRPAT